VIADRADHTRLKLSEGDFVRQVADVQLGIVMAAGIRAVNEGPRISEAAHIRERHRLVVQQKVRDRPGHCAHDSADLTGREAARGWGRRLVGGLPIATRRQSEKDNVVPLRAVTSSAEPSRYRHPWSC